MDGSAIRRANFADADDIADILGEAFEADPVMNWMFGDPKSFRTVFHDLACGLYLRHGFGHMIYRDAAALWLPARTPVKIPALVQLKIAYCAIKVGGVAATRRILLAGNIMARHHPDEPHYYLFAIGVRRGAQGRGLGGAILRAGVELADADGVTAYLENSNGNNTPLYERCGFAPVANLPLPHGAPPLLGMRRPPAGAPI